MKIVSSLFLLLGLLASCQSPQEKAKEENKFSWNAGISAPKNYIATPFVEYFYKGKGIAGTSTNVGIDPGWGINSGGYSGGDNFKPVPDSVYVKWSCGLDLITYDVGCKLPRKRMLELFNKGAINPYNGKKDDYTVLVAGTAPGGNVAIWMKAGQVITEVLRFKAKKVSQEGRYDLHTITLWTSTGQEAKDILTYINLHGVPYKIWETGDKEYNYDIGFSSEDGEIKPEITTFYAKDGSLYQAGGVSTFENIDWNILKYINNNNLVKKQKLPVQILAEWEKDSVYYCTNIVFPQNFQEIFSNSYEYTNKYEHFDRIVIGVKKDGNTGIIWIEGKGKRKKIMNFKVFRGKKNEMGSYIGGGYSLPKGFVFPKWEGREPLKTPEFEYWQEK